MQGKELRIGNLILKDGEEIIVTSYTFFNVEKDSESYEPIPLTEEWLIKFGFEKRNQCYYWINDICVHFNNSGLYNYNLSTKGTVIVYDVTKVHQLQNLYFALTGNELEIK